ncbi:MAG: serine hydrolase domain-containing protein [Parvularculaceae bacterium]
MLKRLAAACAGVFSLLGVAPAADDAFQSRLAEFAASDDVVGLAAAVVRGGKTTLIGTYGVRAIDGEAPIARDTRFRIASLSKGFASSVVAQLLAEKKLSLDDSIATYAPDFRLRGAPARAATLEAILSHRVGLPPYAYDNLLEAGVPPREIRRRLGDVKPVCGIAQCYAYQNVAYDTIADAIAEVDGRPYADAVRVRLFEPLALKSASFGRAALTSDENWARPHRRRRGANWRVVEVKPFYYALPAAGGVNATVDDMAAWLAAQMGYAPEVLDEEMRAELHRPRVSTPAEIRRLRLMRPHLKDAQYGLGWRIYDYAGETVVSHSGSVDGYSAQIAFLPARDAGLVLLTNSRSKAFWGLMPAFLNNELGLAMDNADGADAG